MRIGNFIAVFAISGFLSYATAVADIFSVVQDGNTLALKEMLSSDPKLANEKSPLGMTPLHYAAASDSADSALLLIRAGADVRAQTSTGVTPLQLAVRNGSPNVMRILITRTGLIYKSTFIDAMFEHGQKARDNGELAKANEMILIMLKEDPGNENINFTRGMLCSSLGDYSRANMAFERVIQINPRNDRARLELANTYIAIGQPELAREQLQLVLAHNPPVSLQNKIEQYMKQVSRSSRRWQCTARTDVAFFYDDNINVGPDASIIDIEPIIVGSTVITQLSLSEASHAIDSEGYSAMISISGAYDVGRKDDWSLTGDTAYYQSWLSGDNKEYENLFGLLIFGARKYTPRSMTHLKTQVTHISTGHNTLMNIYGINPTFLYAVGKSGSIHNTVSFTAELRDYDTLNYRDGSYFKFSDNMKWYLGQTGHNISAGVGVMHDNTDSAAYTYSGFEGTIAGNIRLPLQISIYVQATYTDSNYEEKEDLAPEKRSDSQMRFITGISKVISSRCGIDASFQRTDNNSTFDLYEYQRNITTLSAYVSF